MHFSSRSGASGSRRPVVCKSSWYIVEARQPPHFHAFFDNANPLGFATGGVQPQSPLRGRYLTTIVSSLLRRGSSLSQGIQPSLALVAWQEQLFPSSLRIFASAFSISDH